MGKDFMRIEEALNIVLELAAENAIGERDIEEGDEPLREEARGQQTALATVLNFYTNVIQEGYHAPKVLIWMEGGLVDWISANREIEAVVIEYDKDAEQDEMIPIKTFQRDEVVNYCVRDWGEIEATPEAVEHYFSEARKERPEPEKREFTFVVEEKKYRKITVMAINKEKAEEEAREMAEKEAMDPEASIKIVG